MKDTVLVTGASGFIGSAVARILVQEGYDVWVLLRRSSPVKNLEGLNVRKCYGDLLDQDSLASAIRECRYLFHVAAHYKLYNRPADLPYRVNVEGTRNVLAQAYRHGIERVVYTSSVSAVGIAPHGIGDEKTPLDPKAVLGHYKKSKVLAEQEVMRWAQRGLPVTIVNPAAPIGHGDVKPTPTGRIVLDYLRGKMLGYMDTGLNVIDVEDVAQGHLLALRRGKIGERYILGHRNMTLLEMFKILEGISGIPAPRWKIPFGLAVVAGVVGQAWARVSGNEPVVTVDAVRMARKKMFFDASRAVRELGLPQSSIPRAFEKAVEWFCRHGYVSGARHARLRKHFSIRNGGVHETAIAR